ncbi:hypothetical protein [Lysinibacillus sp. UGB7]
MQKTLLIEVWLYSAKVNLASGRFIAYCTKLCLLTFTRRRK